MKALRFLLLAACSLGLCVAASAQSAEPEGALGKGGTLTAPTTVGQNITVTGVQLASGKTASLSCEVTLFGATAYEWKWACKNGTLSVDGTSTAAVTGDLTLTCAGGLTHGTTCWHVFVGKAVDNDADFGAVLVVAKGGNNNAPGAVTLFAATW
jgi:hypothetical protein